MILGPITISLAFLTARVLSSNDDQHLAPLVGMNGQDRFPDEYIVVLHDNHTLEQHFQNIGRSLASEPEFHRYTFGYTAILDEKTRDELVRSDEGVRMVEASRPVYAIEPEDVTVFESAAHLHNKSSHLSKREYRTTIQEDAPYGLQMITTAKDRLDIPILDGGYYEYLANAGQGVQVYIMDTGIRTTHKRFGGRARNFGNLGPDDKSPYVDATMADVRGHGTHVAGIVGAEQYGVAPLASLINVKVLDNNGKVGSRGQANIAQAILDITAEHRSNRNKARTDPNPWTFRGSVINMSFAWAGDGAFLIQCLIQANDAGISVFAAAGNNAENTGDWYPCAAPEAKCIAAVDATYNKWARSNYGWTVNYVAPGLIIAMGEVSTAVNGNSDIAIAKMSGTSQASPHAAGAAAIFASWGGLETHYDLSQNFVYQNSLSGIVTGFSSDTTTYLINTGIHSPKKYPNEPFRWARDHPHEPQSVDDPTSVFAATASDFPTGPLMTVSVYTDMVTSTVGPFAGMTTLASVFDGDDGPFETVGSAQATSAPATPTAVDPTCASSGTAFAQPPAQTLISTFCEQPGLDAQFVPYIAFGNGTSQLGYTKKINADGHFILDGTSNVIWFQTRFSRDGGCTGSFNGTYKCDERFSTILNGCQTDTTIFKLGGVLTDGCAQYTLTAVDEHMDPFKAEDALLMGSFTCKDTASPLNNMYPNTCTCWMSELADQTAIFVRPANGVCDGESVNQVDGLVPGQGY